MPSKPPRDIPFGGFLHLDPYIFFAYLKVAIFPEKYLEFAPLSVDKPLPKGYNTNKNIATNNIEISVFLKVIS